MNRELIEQIKNGTPLYYDIDNVELFNKVCYAVTKKTPIMTAHKYYWLGNCFWHYTDSEPNNSIPLSAFLEPKMVEVHEKHTLMEFLDYCKKGKEVGLTIETSLHDALLNFLNQQ